MKYFKQNENTARIEARKLRASQYPIKFPNEGEIKRITIQKLVTDVISAFNIERGLIYTIKLLLSKPGLLVHKYLHEGRFQLFNVFRLLLITTAASLFVMYLIGIEEFIQGFSDGYNSEDEILRVDPNKLQQLFFDWYNLFLWLAIPIYALFSYLLNRRHGYNYAEHMIMQTFQISAINVINTICLLLASVVSMDVFFYSVVFAPLIFYFWMLTSWLKSRSLAFVLKNLFGFVIANLVYFIVVFMIIFLMLTKH